MLEKLDEVEKRFEEVIRALSEPNVVQDMTRFTSLNKEKAELEPIVEKYKAWKRIEKDLDDSKELLESEKDTELKDMAQEEISSLSEQSNALRQELLILLIPKDANDDKNVILEMRAGAGGDEASLFAEDLFATYSRYAENRGWSIEILSSSTSSVGGFKEIIAMINGHGAYSLFKHESGVHRVQRVPDTESQGRIHTSTITVATLPEAEEVDLKIDNKDLRIDVFRASGPGGQSVNTTDSAVRITHLPTEEIVICQDGKSQHKNKEKALTVLRSRLLKKKELEAADKRQSDRRSQIGTGSRSEKIRTYNYPQGRVTDHRIGLTVYQLESIMGGELDIVIEPLITHYRAEALKNQ